MLPQGSDAGAAGAARAGRGAPGLWGGGDSHCIAVFRSPVLCLLPLPASSHHTRPPPGARGTGHLRPGLLRPLQPRARAAAFAEPPGRRGGSCR